MSQGSNNTDASRHCKGGTTEAIQKKKHFIWIASFLAMSSYLLFTSCEKEIEFKGEQIDPKIVMNGIMEPGKPVSVTASKSAFFLDNIGDMQAPDDLVAKLFVNGNRIGEMTPHYDTLADNGWYLPEMGIYRLAMVFTHDYCPVEGDIIKITASANGFDDVEGTTSALPTAVTWSLGDYQTILWEVSFEEYEGDTVWTIFGQLELIVEVKDPNPGQTDYFRIHLENGGDSDEDGSSYYVSTSYDDPVFGATVTNNDFIGLDFQTRPAGVFTDMLFDGRSYQIKLPLDLYITLMGDIDEDFFQVPISLEHLSKEFYYYLNTCEQSDEVMQFFAEPIQTYSNVEGGYGIVGGRTVDSLLFALPLVH